MVALGLPVLSYWSGLGVQLLVPGGLEHNFQRRNAYELMDPCALLAPCFLLPMVYGPFHITEAYYTVAKLSEKLHP
jgi:hypothetical protein